MRFEIFSCLFKLFFVGIVVEIVGQVVCQKVLVSILGEVWKRIIDDVEIWCRKVLLYGLDSGGLLISIIR